MRIILADSNRDLCEILCAKLSAQMPAAQVDWVDNGITLLQQVQEHCPDLLVVNLLLPGKDGLEAMKTVRSMNLSRQPALMVLAGYMTPLIHQELCQLNVTYFTAMPCDLSVLAQHIHSCCRELVYRSAAATETKEVRITHLLRGNGLAIHCKGFRYARYGLEWLLERRSEDVSVTKVLYPAVAAHFGTTAANVERAIRSAILAAWQKEGYLLQRELFHQRPTNSEFLAVLYQQLELEQRCSAKG